MFDEECSDYKPQDDESAGNHDESNIERQYTRLDTVVGDTGAVVKSRNESEQAAHLERVKVLR